MHKFFYALYLFIQKNKALAIVIALAYLGVMAFFASQLKFEEDITRILPKNDKSTVTTKVFQQLNFADKITIILEKEKGGSLDDLTELATEMLDSLSDCKSYIKSMEGQVADDNIQETFDFVYERLPYFLDASDYPEIEQQLTPSAIQERVEANYRSLVSPTGMVTRDFILKDPLGLTFIALKKLQQVGLGDDFNLYNGFIITKDSTKILLFINPVYGGSETENNTFFAEKLYRIQANLNQQFTGKANVDYFGSSLIAVANAKQIKHDIQTTVIISMSALMLILMFFYRKVFIPIILFIPTIFAGVLGLAFLFFFKETISAISLSIGAVLLGVTVDYSLHILTHYKHAADTKTMYKDITVPLIMSGTTNAAAFLCLLFVKSEALQDLGIFAAIAIFFSAIFSLILIPHLYAPSAKNALKENNSLIDKFAGITFHRNKIIMTICVLAIVISCFTFQRVKFNNNLSTLNYIPEEIQQAEKTLEQSTSLTNKTIYLATYGNSLNEALVNNEHLLQTLTDLKSKKALNTFSNLGGLVASEKVQAEKLARWNAFWQQHNANGALKTTLQQAGFELGFKPESHQDFYALLENKNISAPSLADYERLKAIPINDFITEKDGFFTVLSLVKVDEEERDNLVRKMDQQADVVVIDRQQMNETFLGKLKDDFTTLVNYSFAAVLLILFVFFRKIELVLIATIPIAVTGLVTAGVMAIFGIELNIFSTIVCTLVFGHGVDFSIFMTSAMQKQYTDGKTDLNTYKTSIILAVLTTVLAIGALVFAKHPALKSISTISLIGVLAALIITFAFYPLLFKWCIGNRPAKGKSPITLRLLINSVISFTYYGLGGLLLSTFGWLFITLFPAKKATKQTIFRKVMSQFMKSVLYTNPFAKKRIINAHQEDFSKPAVIIANHTSFLDTLAVGMLSHKIIFLVNDWVYNSPIFGRAVKLAGFYPVSQGIENSYAHLEEKIKEGYSLMIFPEGTRSKTQEIHRFHKGAFLLAEKFQLDILPIYIHGNSEVLPKGDFIIYDQAITVEIGERIPLSDTTFGTSYDQRTKLISKHFKQHFADLRAQLEGDYYFNKLINLSFLYKENEVVNTVKTDLINYSKQYATLSKGISQTAKINHVGNDLGHITILLALNAPKRKITSFITDELHRSIAATNYLTKKLTVKYVEESTTLNPQAEVLLITIPTDQMKGILETFTGNILILFDKESVEYWEIPIDKTVWELTTNTTNTKIFNRL